MDLDTVVSLLTKVAVFTPVVTGVVQAIKMAGFPGRFLPFVAMLIGAVVGWFFVAASSVGIFVGIAVGLASVGLYEFAATTVAGKGQG